MNIMNNILITGNQGYIGPALVAILKEQYPSSTVTGLDTGFFESRPTIQRAYPQILPDYQMVGDVRQLDASVLSGFDAVIHLAAISNDPMGETFSDVTKQINLEASKDLARRAKMSGVKRFVFASSCSVYGASDDNAFVNEESPLVPVTTYAKSKVLMEKYLSSLASPDFQVVCLRFATACGASSRLRLDLVLNDFVYTALTSNKIKILSDGSPWRPLIDTQDMSRALIWACYKYSDSALPFLAVNVGRNDNNFRISELAECVASQLPRTQIVLNKDASPDKRSYKVDFNRFKQLAGADVPQMCITQSISQLIDCIEPMLSQGGGTQMNDYKRLHILKGLIEAKHLDSCLYWNRSPAV
ncbi:SDR family oxidoreductase [Bowmanella denitrificans]|uniref:SDR family oxidoreductase n=1 Tax=Bowmanella denitrificans TaxID=366582 RepID=A0ABN0XKQ3_9ALTE